MTVATSSRPREHASYHPAYLGGAIDRRAAARRARVPSLDGLRALSISAVILGHVGDATGFPAHLAWWLRNPYWDVANLGVRVFFVISGFLISHLLLREEAEHGTISLRAFYERRARRILPAYLTYVFVIAVLAMWDVVSIPGGGLLAALTFTMNYTANGGAPLSHLWSLAVGSSSISCGRPFSSCSDGAALPGLPSASSSWRRSCASVSTCSIPRCTRARRSRPTRTCSPWGASWPCGASI
jgi:hypothetical protein